MIRRILSAISPLTRIVSGLHAVQIARLIRERRDAEQRAAEAEYQRDIAIAQRDDTYKLIAQRTREYVIAIDERDAAGFAHASALRDIDEARRLAGMPATASPQDIVRALLARQN